MRPIYYIPEESKLTFVRQTVFTAPDNRKRWKGGEKQIMARAVYRCVCGVEKEIVCAKVKSGHTRSCGCFRKDNPTTKHGYYYHPLYKIFFNIKRRCYNRSSKAYKDYGGRGVIICNEWLDNPILFVEWGIQNGWAYGLHLDKDILSEKMGLLVPIYSPETCQFVTPKANNNSKRNHRMIEFNGKIKNLAQWSEETGIERLTIYARIKKGWAIERALTEPLKINQYG